MKKNTNLHNFIFIGFVLLIIGCAVIVTLVSKKIEDQFHLRWDLTDNQVYSIGDTTKEVLRKLEKDITIYTLYQSGSEDRTISELLRRYEQESSHIEVKNIDPLEKPYFTKQFETGEETIGQSSLIIQENGSKNFRVINAQNLYEWQLEEDQLYATGTVAELRVTAAVASISGGKQTTVYFVTGHGEMDVTKEYYLSETLMSDGYKVESYDLIYNNTALEPDDCLLFLAPLQDLTDEEYQMVQNFMDKGGKAVFLINPLAGEVVHFNKLFATYGLELEDNLIAESDIDCYLNSQVIIRPQMNEENPVLQSVVTSNAGLVLPRCRGISTWEIKEIEIDPILYSSKSSYGKVDPYTETLDKEDGDTEGPFSLGVTATSNKNGSKLVLLGNSDFVSTLENAKYEGNIALFMDSVAWASEKEDSVVIQPKSLVSAPLKIKSTAAGYRLMVLVIIVIPALILGCGAAVWKRRLSR